MLILLPEFKEWLDALNKHRVNFMLIGGYAVIFHGYERTTNDLDIWLEPANENKIKFCDALNEYGIDQNSIKRVYNADFSIPQVFFFGDKPRRIDFLTKVNHVDYYDAASQVSYLHLKNEDIPVISYDHLILTKITNEREGDKKDVENLQRIRRHKLKAQSQGIFQKIRNLFFKK